MGYVSYKTTKQVSIIRIGGESMMENENYKDKNGHVWLWQPFRKCWKLGGCRIYKVEDGYVYSYHETWCKGVFSAFDEIVDLLA